MNARVVTNPYPDVDLALVDDEWDLLQVAVIDELWDGEEPWHEVFGRAFADMERTARELNQLGARREAALRRLAE